MITLRNDTGPFVSEWLEDSLLFSVKEHNVSSWSIVHDDRNKTSYEAYVETIEQSCTPKSVLYNVNVTSLRSVQSLEHHLSDEKEMPKKWNGSQTGMTLDVPAERHAARDWNQMVLDMLPAFNEWALLDALGSSLEGVFLEQSPTYHRCKPRAGPENGTMIEDCIWDYTTPCFERRPLNSPKAPLISTVFQLARFDSSRESSIYDCDDHREDLELTEALLNDVLTNITLSAISLGTWWTMVPVNVTRYQSTYPFANPLSLILPYSICLTAAIIFAAIAIWSLLRNGIPAVDGGFLQIMTATRGNTKMEQLVLREKSPIIENMSAELKGLKVRYGELVGENASEAEGRIIGFGTIEETVSLRKRK
ncbi:hypothetical protein HBH69_060440 [Parastagonospora nodorum]|nr:hypothetical protein HBH69_060440 [Parastagonospora nodorum]